ncbi:MAG: hypothetical protein GY929_25590 [Actinomycetia bacterium]|nr:hypothetical protein [Actinomycetes bacterium]
MCAQIGAIGGPWTADPVTGRIYKQARPAVREAGVKRNLPHISDNGQGVNHAGTREAGVSRGLPHLSDDGRGVNHAGTREAGVSDVRWLDDTNPDGFHPVTMPELVRWMRWLSARLRHVRILNGDWARLVTTGAAWHLPVRSGKGPAGVFLDPPYSSTERASGLYNDVHDNGDVAQRVNEWCASIDPAEPKWRIVLAGYDNEHANLEDLGWTVHEWFTDGHLTGGMGNIAKGTGTGDHQQKRERLWASPQCDPPDRQPALFD